jgi:hypothetical protein
MPIVKVFFIIDQTLPAALKGTISHIYDRCFVMAAPEVAVAYEIIGLLGHAWLSNAAVC